MRSDASRQPPSPSSELTPPLPVLSPHPALAGPRGMGAGETELAGWGDDCGGLGGRVQVESLWSPRNLPQRSLSFPPPKKTSGLAQREAWER